MIKKKNIALESDGRLLNMSLKDQSRFNYIFRGRAIIEANIPALYYQSHHRVTLFATEFVRVVIDSVFV